MHYGPEPKFLRLRYTERQRKFEAGCQHCREVFNINFLAVTSRHLDLHNATKIQKFPAERRRTMRWNSPLRWKRHFT